MNPFTQLRTGKLSTSFTEVSRFERQPHERVLLSLCHPRVYLANNPKQKPTSLHEDAVCRMCMWELGDWMVQGMACKMLADTSLNLAQRTSCCVVAFGWKMLVVSEKLPLQMRCSHPLQCCDRCQCWGLLAWCAWVAQGPLFHPLCADTAEAACLGMHLPLASMSWGQRSDRNRNSDWAKLICTLVRAAGCQVSYSGFCKIIVPGPWYIRNAICFSWNLPKLVILHIPKSYNPSSVSSLPLV